MRKLLMIGSIVTAVALVLTFVATAREGLEYHVTGTYWETCSSAP